MTPEWYTRPVLHVADVDRTLDFYVNRLGFTQSWRFEHDGIAVVAQAERQACALIFSSQWPDKAGNGLVFVSLNVDDADNADSAIAGELDLLRAEFESKGVAVRDD